MNPNEFAGRVASPGSASALLDRRAGFSALVSLALLACPLGATAGSWSDGLYLELFGGVHGLAGGDLRQGISAGKVSYSVGPMYGAALGKNLSPRWALETEFFYRSNDLDSVRKGILDGSSVGDFASANLMFNGLYTLTRPDGSALWRGLSPYCGAGVGVLQEADMDLKVGGVTRQYSGNWMPAAQALLGVRYALNQRWSLFLETRYHFAGEIELKSGAGDPSIKADYNGLSGVAGLRLTF